MQSHFGQHQRSRSTAQTCSTTTQTTRTWRLEERCFRPPPRRHRRTSRKKLRRRPANQLQRRHQHSSSEPLQRCLPHLMCRHACRGSGLRSSDRRPETASLHWACLRSRPLRMKITQNSKTRTSSRDLAADQSPERPITLARNI